MIGGGKVKGSSSAEGSQSWHELAGPRRRRVNSPQAQKRRLFRVLRMLAILLVLGLCGVGVFLGFRALREREKPVQIQAPSRAIEQLLFETDGVLPDRWLSEIVQMRKGMTMMEADLRAIKERIESQPQVKSVAVERIFPSALKIRVEEEEPTLRMAVATPDGRTEQRIVSRSGRIYKGVGYPKAMVARLPFVQPFQYPDGSYQPMRGIDRVAELLAAARRRQPEFYQSWRVVSLTHFSGDASVPGEVIEVRSSRYGTIVFSGWGDFERQLDRLAVIFNYLAERGDPSVKRIDLSLRDSAAVQFSSGRISSF
jgi:cell division septal protein FtsQ